ncbi:atg16-protein [Fusarium longipes]|uniref:Atg16-protein n=1 Tax=Fusarium longipes TaxID=694270 RepID=A0A395RNJ4_9HYPO|nr:atg16-protein [Fusarium longipes]
MTTITRDEWILSRAASTLEEMKLSNGYAKCHLDEAIVLCNYLNGEMNAKSAARAITATVCSPLGLRSTTLDELRRVMSLISETLMRYGQDCDKILDLLVAMQDLPPARHLCWWKLPAFGRVWQRCYLVHRDRQCTAFYKKAGTLEANMYLRELYPVDVDWVCKTINVVCLELSDLGVVIYEIHAMLEIAGSKLVENLQPGQVKAYTRAMRGRSDKTYMIEVTLYEHWEHWKKRFLQISYDEEFLQPEARLMAGKCHEIMRGHRIRQPHEEAFRV